MFIVTYYLLSHKAPGYIKLHRAFFFLTCVFLHGLTFANSSANINVSLTILPGPSQTKATLFFDSIPSGISINVNGKPSGVTPYQGIDHRVGENVRIELSDARYLPYTTELTLNSEITNGPPATLIPAKGKLLVTMNQALEGAKVLIDGKVAGTIPANLNLPIGLHYLSVQTAYQNSQTMVVDIAIGKTTSMMFGLSETGEIIFRREKINGYTKIDSNGEYLDDSATEWQCVLDHNTGLIWEVKTNDGSFRDKDWKYSQAEFALKTNCHDQMQCETQKYVDDVNTIELCGQKKWRLPTIFELTSLETKPQWNVDDTNKAIKTLEAGGTINPNIDPEYFPNTKNGFYWSSTPFGSRVFGVDFLTGDPYKTAFRDEENYTRLVMENL